MSSLFGRLKGSSTPGLSPNGSNSNKKTPTVTPSTPLEQLLVDAGPVRGDGSDKFFGMYNPSNTCYCNSVLQCLFHSEPFRHQVVEFPRKTPAHLHLASASGGPPAVNGMTPLNTSTPVQSSTPNVDTLSPASPRKVGATPVTTTSSLTKAEENKSSFDYQKKQALANGPNIRMDRGNFETYGMPESLFTGLKDIFEAVITHESRTGVITPEKFLEVLRRNYELFRSPMHQDAHEFLNILLNEVVEQVEAYSKQKQVAGLGIALSPPAPDAAEPSSAVATKPSNNTSWVHELFEGTLTSETRCLTCENISQRDEPFLDLSVDLEEHSSVTSCLAKFSEEEMMCGRNKFHCDKCGGLQEAEKRMKVKRLPHIVALHLKRFKYVEEAGRMQKLFHRVVFPFHLRLPNTTDDAEDPDRLYELYGIIVHLGSTPFHGHYVSIIKTADKGWLLFDDELVLPVDRNYVRNFFGGDPRNPACAYVLFYQETTEDAILREQDAEDTPAELAKIDDIADTPALTLDTNGIITSGSISPAHSPDGDRPNSLLALDHVATAPNPPTSAPLLSPNDALTHTATEDLSSTSSATVDGLDGVDSKPASGQVNIVKSGSLKFRHPSLSFRTRPKFWSKDKGESLQDAAENEPDGTSASPQEQTNAQNQEQSPEKADRPRSGRFGLGRKK